jgi:hypothetical protein
MSSVRTSFRTERGGLRVYEIEDEAGRKFYLEETSDSALVFRREEDKPLNLHHDFVSELVPLFEHFAKYGNLPLPSAEAPAFKVDDVVACSREKGTFRIAKISWSGDDSNTRGSAYLLRADEAGTDHGWEDFRKLRPI